MTAGGFDPVGVLRTLISHDVAFVVIGGYAAELRGAPLMTNDLDVCYERSLPNMERLATALRAIGATLRVARVDDTSDLPFILDALTLAAGDSFTFSTELGPVDILATPSGTSGFKDLAAKAALVPVASDLDVLVVDIEDLMRMKRASQRTKDRMHLEVLAAVRDEIERAQGSGRA